MYVNYVNKIAEKLSDPNTSSKCYWSLLKTLLHGQKIPCIAPLCHGDKYIAFKKNVRFSIIFSLTNVLRFQTKATYLLNYHYGQITHYLLVTLQKMTFLEITCTQIKFTAMIRIVFGCVLVQFVDPLP